MFSGGEFMKKIYLLLITVALSSFLVSCYKAEDLYPKSYGEWEGLYIYKSNYRMRTDGKEVSQLVSKIQVDDEIYDYHFKDNEKINHLKVIDYKYQNDDVYMILGYDRSNAALVHYNLSSKNSNILYLFKNNNWNNQLFKLFNNSMVIKDGDNYVELDYNGTIILDNADEYKDYIYFDDHIFKLSEGSIYARHIDEKVFDLIYSKDSKLEKHRINRIIKSEELLFVYLVLDEYSYNRNSLGENIIVYNLITDKTTEVLVSNEQSDGAINIGKDYFMTYRIENVIGSFNINHQLKLKNKLYKFNDDGNHDLIYTFNEDEEFLYTYHVFDDNTINFMSFRYANKSLFSNEKETRYKEYNLNIEKKRLRSGLKLKKNRDNENLGFQIGDYTFIERRVKYGAFMGEEYFYFLLREDKEKKIETMLYIQKDIQSNIDDEYAFEIFTDGFFDTIRDN